MRCGECQAREEGLVLLRRIAKVICELVGEAVGGEEAGWRVGEVWLTVVYSTHPISSRRGQRWWEGEEVKIVDC